MKLTEKDSKIFEALSNSELGKGFVDYLDRLLSRLCDSRTWESSDTKEIVQKVAGIVQSDIIDKIKLRTNLKDLSSNQYE